MKWRTLWGSNAAYRNGLPIFHAGLLWIHLYHGGALGRRDSEGFIVFDLGPFAIRWGRK